MQGAEKIPRKQQSQNYNRECSIVTLSVGSLKGNRTPDSLAAVRKSQRLSGRVCSNSDLEKSVASGTLYNCRIIYTVAGINPIFKN